MKLIQFSGLITLGLLVYGCGTDSDPLSVRPLDSPEAALSTIAKSEPGVRGPASSTADALRPICDGSKGEILACLPLKGDPAQKMDVCLERDEVQALGVDPEVLGPCLE